MLKLIFKYKDKIYTVNNFIEFMEIKENYNLEYYEDWFEDGNFFCDCNRSLIIHEEYPDFELIPCGEEIELLEILLK